MRFKSEIAYTECLSAATVAESFIDNNREPLRVQKIQILLLKLLTRHGNKRDKRASLKELYPVGMILKSDLQNQTPIWYEYWPPLGSDSTTENIKKLISPCLFNFMAWLLGLSDDSEDAQYITLEAKARAMIFLCAKI